MGDRCYLEITYKKADEPKFKEAFSMRQFPEEVISDEDGVIVAAFEEVNYACSLELSKANTAGLAFTGYHSAGDTYGAQRFAAYGGKIAYVDSNSNSELMVVVDEDTGEPSETEMLMVQEYMRLREQAMRYLYGTT